MPILSEIIFYNNYYGVRFSFITHYYEHDKTGCCYRANKQNFMILHASSKNYDLNPNHAIKFDIKESVIRGASKKKR